MLNAKTNSHQHTILGFAGLLCLSALHYKALAADNVLLFSGLSFALSLMWSLMYKLMAPAAKVTALPQLFIFSGCLSLSAAFFIAGPYLTSEPVIRISLFIVANVTMLLALLHFNNRRQLTSE